MAKQSKHIGFDAVVKKIAAHSHLPEARAAAIAASAARKASPAAKAANPRLKRVKGGKAQHLHVHIHQEY